MKKTITILLAVCLCVGLCACGNGTSAQIEYPEDWDRIAEATATLNQYYSCSTAEEFKNVLEKSATARNIQAWVENAAVNSEYVMSSTVRHIQFIDTYKGYDLFMASTNDVYTEEYLAQYEAVVSYYPEGVTPTPSMSYININIVIPLKYEDGRYVIAADIKLLTKLSKDYTDCECDAGQIAVSGDILCDTCSGTGHIETEPDPNAAGAMLGDKAYLTCVDCGGWGTKDFNYVDCTVCKGKGYN